MGKPMTAVRLFNAARRSTWSLPKSMSDFSVSKLSSLTKSPTLTKVLSSPSVSKIRDFSNTSMKQVNTTVNKLNASPSLRKHGRKGNTEENSSEDSLMEERHRKSSSLP